MSSPDLSIVIVNFNSAHFLGPLCESITAQECQIDGRPLVSEVIVVDNASRGDDATMLAHLAANGVKVIQNTMNLGYGQANNQGFHVATGRYHMILNPDACFLPNCFQALIDHLENDPDTAMVGPLAYIDPTQSCLMPPNELPTPELVEKQTASQTNREAALENMRGRTKLAFEYWTAKAPLDMDMLSGSCLVFRRELFAGEFPFDPGFPLYYEDTDMFLRLAAAGRKMKHIPAARMLHYWSQSADSYARGAQYRNRLSAKRYYEKHWGAEGLAKYEKAFEEALRVRDEGQHISPFDFERVEAGVEAPVFKVPEDCENYFVEFAGNPIFTMAIGMLPPEPGDFAVPQIMWQQVGPGDYWIRMVDCDSLATIRSWIVTKS